MIIIGDDWAEGHHDIEMMSPHGEVLTRFRVTEDVDGLEELLSEVHKCTTDDEVVVGIERDNGPWVTALRGYGFTVFAITRCNRPGADRGSHSPAPRATSATRTSWRTWSEPTDSTYSRSQKTPSKPKD